MKVWNVRSRQVSGIQLWKVSKGNFRVLAYDNFTKIMNGPDYIIVHNDLLFVFDVLLNDEVVLSQKVCLFSIASNGNFPCFI